MHKCLNMGGMEGTFIDGESAHSTMGARLRAGGGVEGEDGSGIGFVDGLKDERGAVAISGAGGMGAEIAGVAHMSVDGL